MPLLLAVLDGDIFSLVVGYLSSRATNALKIIARRTVWINSSCYSGPDASSYSCPGGSCPEEARANTEPDPPVHGSLAISIMCNAVQCSAVQ